MNYKYSATSANEWPC